MGRVVRSGQAELIADVRLESAFLGLSENVTSEVTVPLRAQGQVVGTLNVESVDGVVLLSARPGTDDRGGRATRASAGARATARNRPPE